MPTIDLRLRTQFAPRQISIGRRQAASFQVSDVSLVECIAAGDRAAMQTLYAQHSKQIYHYALRLIGNVTAAEHVVTETFVSCWHQAWAFDHRLQVSTWLLGIARGKALALGGLANPSPARRAIIDLVYYHRQSIGDIAEIMHVPRNIVKAKMHDARQRLAASLNGPTRMMAPVCNSTSITCTILAKTPKPAKV